MKVIHFMLIIIIFPFLCRAQTFEKLEHDFSEIAEENGPYEYEFHFSNTEKEPIQIERVKAG